MTNVLKFVVSCEGHSLEENFQGSCFGHVFLRHAKYGTSNEKICKNLKFVSIKFA
jgi:hypothetical protein